jgi:hypothetical protein
MLFSFVWAFFFGSTWGDIHGQTNPDPASASYVNMWVMLGPLIIIYEMFQLYVLPGKRRGRELPWGLYLQIAKEKIHEKLSSGMKEYHEWKKH